MLSHVFINIGLLYLRNLLKSIVAGVEVYFKYHRCSFLMGFGVCPRKKCVLKLFFWKCEFIKQQTSLSSNRCLNSTERTCFHSLLANLLDNICSFPPHSLQTILGVPSLEEVLQPTQIVPEYIIYNMTNTSKHGVVILQNKSGKILFVCFLFLLKDSVWCIVTNSK